MKTSKRTRRPNRRILFLFFCSIITGGSHSCASREDDATYNGDSGSGGSGDSSRFRIKQIAGFEGKYSVAYWEPWFNFNDTPVFDSVCAGPWNVINLASNYVNASNGVLSHESNYSTTFFRNAVTKAHAANMKILYTILIGDEMDTRKVLTGDTKLRHITSICDTLGSYNFDGIDFDWEGGMGGWTPDSARVFLKLLRDSLDTRFGKGINRKWITMYVGPQLWNFAWGELLKSPVHTYIEYATVQGYDYYGSWTGYTGYNGPLYSRITVPGRTDSVPSVHQVMSSLVTFGIPSSKLCPMSRWNGMWYYGGTFPDGNGPIGIGRSWNAAPVNNFDIRFFVLDQHLGVATESNTQYDSIACSEYAVRDHPGAAQDTFASWDGPRTVAAKIAYVRDRGFAGYAGWTVQGMWLGSPTDGRWAPQVRAMWNAFRGGAFRRDPH